MIERRGREQFSNRRRGAVFKEFPSYFCMAAKNVASHSRGYMHRSLILQYDDAETLNQWMPGFE